MLERYSPAQVAETFGVKTRIEKFAEEARFEASRATSADGRNPAAYG